tara:strand:+ start:207 stop:422 length:216 start_codon:yes stop_codon:yes gene_type:complete
MIGKITMKKYKIRLYGMGIHAVGIISFQNYPTVEEIENETALYLNEKLLTVRPDNFYSADRYTLTYEEVSI